MLDINVKTIPHKNQRYDTVGDYWELHHGKLEFRVSECEDVYYEAAIFLHEFVEYFLCKANGVSVAVIDKFDIEYEKNRDPNDTTSQPGDDPESPYREEHRFAENLERLFIQELGIDWNEYDKSVNDVSINSPRDDGNNTNS